MRFESVTARAFGPFANRTLDLAPGLTIVWGPNEAGKSTWHQAISLGLCGLRRGRGRLRTEDQALRRHHRPWDGDGWRVGVVIALADGRRVEIAHDLDGRVACRASDATLGRDYSGEIMHEGAPDGSRWLGLSRSSFPTIACVRQADVLGVLRDSGLLQEYLQRVTATSGTDSTAAAAIDRLTRFQAEQVGQDRANSSRPLPRAREALAEARRALDRARAEHRDYLRLVAQAQDREQAAAAADRRLQIARAAIALARAAATGRRSDRARVLAARFPDGPPEGARAEDDLAQDVTSALDAWQHLPPLPPLDGPSAAELQAQLDALPLPPTGDVDPDPAVMAAGEAARDAHRQIEWHEAAQPASPAEIPGGAARDEDLLGWAAALDAPAPAWEPTLEERLRRARERHAAVTGSKTRPIALTAAAILIAAAVVAFVLNQVVPAMALAVAAIGLAGWGATRGGGTARRQALEELRAAEADLGGRRHAVEEVERRRAAARSRLDTLGLPADPGALRRLVAHRTAAAERRRAFDQWRQQADLLITFARIADEALRTSLAARGAAGEESPLAALSAYETACRERAAIAAHSAQRPLLAEQARVRSALERQAADALTRRRQADDQIRSIGARCRVAGTTPDQIARDLEEWRRSRAAIFDDLDARRAEWAELQALLGDHTPDDLERAADQARERADHLSAGLSGAEIAAALDRDPSADLPALEAAAAEAARAWHESRGQVEERAGRIADVAAAEEAKALAEADLDRLKRLDATLTKTREFLERAQQEVHYTVSAVLADAVGRRLPRVTGDRYREARVDPTTLAVQVRGAGTPWRDAEILSGGTREQIYLLLRIALAEHLTKPGETCPLIFDDVTVQCDRDRTRAVLDLLHEVARERQVILFSQEDAVRAWAEARLREPEDRLIRLDPVAIGA